MSAEGRYEADLKKAIKQSMKSAKAKQSPIIISDSEDDLPVIVKPKRVSKKRPRPADSPTKDKEPHSPPIDLSTPPDPTSTSTSTATTATTPPANSFLSERAQLEKGRLERQKRLREMGKLPPEDAAPPTKRQRSKSVEQKTAVNGIASTSKTTVPVIFGKSKLIGARKTTAESRFWDGEIRQSGNIHVKPENETGPTFRLSEILGATDELQMAILSSYSTNVSWIYSMFPPRVPVILVQQPDESGNAKVKNILPNWVMTAPFMRGGRGAMHVKLLMLFYEKHIRVCIPTGNLQQCDWREIENTVWLQDFPITTSPSPSSSKATKNKEDFIGILTKVLTKLNVVPALMAALRDNPNLPIKSLSELRTSYDWSKAKVHLVPCMSGKYEGWPEAISNGHPRLMKAIRDANARAGPGRSIRMECQGSSIGSYITSWLNEIYHSALGESAEDWLDQPKARRSKLSFPRVKIVYPTLKFIRESEEGELGGGTLFCRRSQWEGKGFPRELFHESRSKRGKVAMHSKMIIATFKDTGSSSSTSSKKKTTQKRLTKTNAHSSDSDDIVEIEPGIDQTSTIHGWAYIGSANFTSSAWGTLSGTSFKPILNITNYELGILVPLTRPEMADELSCFERPPKRYGPSDVPWMQEESELIAAVRAAQQ